MHCIDQNTITNNCICLQASMTYDYDTILYNAVLAVATYLYQSYDICEYSANQIQSEVKDSIQIHLLPQNGYKDRYRIY